MVEAAQKERVSIVIGAGEATEALRPLVTRIDEVMTTAQIDCEILVAPDAGVSVAEKIVSDLAAAGRPVRLIRGDAGGQAGLAALLACKQSSGEVIVYLQAEAGPAPEEILLLLDALRAAGTEMVIGRNVVSIGRVKALLARPFTGAHTPLSGLFAIRRSVFERGTSADPAGPRLSLEFLVKCRCTQVGEVPAHFAPAPATGASAFARRFAYVKHLKRLSDFKYRGFSHFAQFSLVGVSGAAVDLSFYYVFLKAGMKMQMKPAVFLPLSRALAIWIAMTWNFIINRRLTFSFSRKTSALKQYPLFVASCGVGAVVSWSAAVGLAAWVGFFEKHYMTAAVVGILGGLLFNYSLSRHWVFRQTAAPGEKE